MSFIRTLISRAGAREGGLESKVGIYVGDVQTLVSEHPQHDAEPPYFAVDEHYGDKLSAELDRLTAHETRLMAEISQREKRLAEVRRSQRALNAGLAVLQADMEASAV